MSLTGDIFYGERLQLAREFRQLTQTELADQVVASNALISQYESGKKVLPSPDLAAAFGLVLGFLPEFFYYPIEDAFRPEECSFRHRRSATEKLKSHVRAHGTLLGMVLNKLRKYYRFPKLDIPEFRADSMMQVEVAAENARRHWGIGLDAPIKQVGRVLENAGVVIAPNVVETEKIDAFSRLGENAIIFLNRAAQGSSRLIFDIGHECGHLVMHRGLQTGTVETEKSADRFSSAFLMPGAAFEREFGRSGTVSWKRVFDCKRYWMVSAASIIHRAHDLGLIGPVEYRRAFQYMSLKKWRSGVVPEPYEPDFQEPELLKLAIDGLGAKSGKVTIRQLCSELFFEPHTFKDVTEFPVPFEGKSSSHLAITPIRKING